LSKEAFTHLSALEVVHLGENRIMEIGSDTFIHARSLKVTVCLYKCAFYNNNNIHICIAPYGRNFRGAGPGSVLVGMRRGKRVSLGEEKCL